MSTSSSPNAEHADAAARLAVFGSPIAHSKSPTLHRIAYERLGFAWSYDSRQVEASELADVIASLGDEWRGLSLTMPLKQQAFALCDELDAIATATGAVNTIRFRTVGDRRVLAGFNTDVGGIVRAIGAAGTASVHAAAIIGGGATASSAVLAVAELGALHVTVAVRDATRAAHLGDLATSLGLTIDFQGLDVELPAVPLVVSTLPGGAGVDPAPFTRHAAEALLFDVAYDPWPSDLARAWEQAGGNVLNGLAMLVHQAVLQIRIFRTGDPLVPLDDEDAVLEAMLASVGLSPTGSTR